MPRIWCLDSRTESTDFMSLIENDFKLTIIYEVNHKSNVRVKDVSQKTRTINISLECTLTQGATRECVSPTWEIKWKHNLGSEKEGTHPRK